MSALLELIRNLLRKTVPSRLQCPLQTPYNDVMLPSSRSARLFVALRHVVKICIRGIAVCIYSSIESYWWYILFGKRIFSAIVSRNQLRIKFVIIFHSM